MIDKSDGWLWPYRVTFGQYVLHDFSN